jgi:O-antigen/teichoic acid export membrane protein
MASSKILFGRDVLIAAMAAGLKSLRNLLLIRFISFNLSIAEYGIWEQISVGIALLLPWFTLQLPSALLRFLPGIEDQSRWREDFYSILSFVAGTTTVSAIIVWTLLKTLSSHPHFAPFAVQSTLIAVLIPLSATVNTCITLLRALRRFYHHSVITLVQNFSEFALIGVLLERGNDLGSALLSLALVRLTIALVGLRIAFVEFGFALPTFHRLREYLAYSIPLVPNSTFYRIFDACDRFVLSGFIGHAAVGTYAAVYAMGSFFATLISPINMVLLPLMAELWNQQRHNELGEYLTQSIRYSTLLSLPALAGASYLAPSLLSLLVPSAAAEGAIHFALICCSFLVFGIGILGGNVLATAARTRLLLAIDISLATFNLVLNVLMVPFMGIMGAVLATLLSHLFYAFAVLYQARKITPFVIPWLPMMHCVLGSLIMLTALYLLDLYLSPLLPVQIAVGAAAYSIFMVLSGGIERRELLFFVRTVKNLTS